MSGGGHDSHGGHAAAEPIIPTGSFQDRVLMFIATLALAGLGLWMWGLCNPITVVEQHPHHAGAPGEGHHDIPAGAIEHQGHEVAAPAEHAAETATPATTTSEHDAAPAAVGDEAKPAAGSTDDGPAKLPNEAPAEAPVH